MYDREDLKDGIEIISNRHDSLIWLKLDRIFFQVEHDRSSQKALQLIHYWI